MLSAAYYFRRAERLRLALLSMHDPEAAKRLRDFVQIYRRRALAAQEQERAEPSPAVKKKRQAKRAPAT
jgi:hypothetical protein